MANDLWIHIETIATDESNELMETFVGSIDYTSILVILHYLRMGETRVHVSHGFLGAELVA